MINIIIVEDNRTIREGLAALINGTPDFRCIGAFGDCESFLCELSDLPADVVLMDIGLPGMSGIEGVKRAKQIDPELSILILTVYEDNDIVYDALCAGACGYLVKKTPPSRLLEAIREIHDGGSPMSSTIARKVITTFQRSKGIPNDSIQFDLTLREKQVLQSLGDGNNYQEISDSLFISVDTVRHHIRNIYRKLHVHSQTQAVAKAIRKGLI
jgi:DNA-binding NarL/FixJ family response regulator